MPCLSPIIPQPSGLGAVLPAGAGARRQSQLEPPEAAGGPGLHCGGAGRVPAGPGAHRGSPVSQPSRSALGCAFTAALDFRLPTLKAVALESNQKHL